MLVKTPHIALPNVLLGRRALPELVQGEATAQAIARAGEAALPRAGEARAIAEELRVILTPPSPEPFGKRVADLLEDWLR
jgi:lipid-A-disaccharide synthase